MSGHDTASDSLSIPYYIEIKDRTGAPKSWRGIVKLFEDTERKAKAEGKRAILYLHPARAPINQDSLQYVRLTDGKLAGAIVAVTVRAFQASEEHIAE
jgi:hypothetical protein